MCKTRKHRLVCGLLLGLVALCSACWVRRAENPTSVIEKKQPAIYYDNGAGLWRLTLPDKETTLLVKGPGSPEYLELYGVSADYKWLSYTLGRGDSAEARRSTTLWIVSTSGGEPFQVSQRDPVLGARWLTDGHLLYVEYPDAQVIKSGAGEGWIAQGEAFAYLFDPETQERERIMLSPLSEGCGSLTRPGVLNERAELCRSLDDDSVMPLRNLRIVSLTGGETITVVEPYQNIQEVVWSLDGEQLAFIRHDEQGGKELLVWNRQNRAVERILYEPTSSKYGPSSPTWSPDGQWIAYQGDENSLCVIRVSDRFVKCFVDYIASLAVVASWSPDSQAVVIYNNHVGDLAQEDAERTWDLFVISIPDGDITRLTNSSEGGDYPIWSYWSTSD